MQELRMFLQTRSHKATLSASQLFLKFVIIQFGATVLEIMVRQNVQAEN